MRIPLFLYVAFLLATSYAQIPTNGLIACYAFTSDASDPIGGYDGTLQGSSTTNGTLIIGGNDQDALFIPGQILNNISAYSTAFRVKFTNFHTNHASAANVFFSGASAANDNLMNFAYAKDQLPGGAATLINTVFYVHNNTRFEFNNISLATNVWYHFVLVRDVNNIKLYIDGVEQMPISGISVPAINFSLVTNGFVWGQDQDVLAGGFQSFQSLNGEMDDLLVYDRALTATEVIDIYSADHNVVFSNVERVEAAEISIYPNPANDRIELKFPRSGQWMLQIYNSSGKEVLEQHVQGEQYVNINVADLVDGTYLLIAMDPKVGTRVKKKLLVLR